MKIIAVTVIAVVLFHVNKTQSTWSGPAMHHHQHDQKIVYDSEKPSGYVQNTNAYKQSTFVPLKAIYDAENARREKQLHTTLFYTVDEWPLHIETEEYQPDIIVDDSYNSNLPEGAQMPDVVSVEKTHFLVTPNTIKEEQTYFNNKDGQQRHWIHKNLAKPTSEFVEQTIVINPEANYDMLKETFMEPSPVNEDKPSQLVYTEQSPKEEAPYAINNTES
ncbi:hypothetical protein FQA39_LY05949 [Lamprigera yunnana]|nr:hypothetical protein FQA39_LY05949 [Lamprigera yunnana]